MSDVKLTDCWGTPDDFYGLIRREFSPVTDVCAESFNTCVDNDYITASGLPLDCVWTTSRLPVAWCNPPYSQVGRWAKYAYEDVQQSGGTVLFLPPASIETNWWRDWILKAAEIRMLIGRIKFMPPPGLKASSPRGPNALVIFRKHYVKSPPPPRVWWWDWRKDLEG